MSHKNFIAIFTSTLLLILAPAVANALVVTIEPDDYGVGADLTNVSPYVTLQVTGESGAHPVFADAGGALGSPDYVAPTGTLTFGHYGLNVLGPKPDYTGFTLTFHQAVSRVSLLANSEYSTGSLRAHWIAFDQVGDIIGQGMDGSHVPAGETFGVDIQLDNIWSVVMGGEDAIAAINFDYLTFEFDDSTSVPEPNALLLLLSGLLTIALRKRSCRNTA